mmetsp:Transcript_8460/g.19883  ORF Transcript_8460/g.19883 Transcript_8460/m.19883 type:complete len:201 (-) Transcript_8460:107-709(-)
MPSAAPSLSASPRWRGSVRADSRMESAPSRARRRRERLDASRSSYVASPSPSLRPSLGGRPFPDERTSKCDSHRLSVLPNGFPLLLQCLHSPVLWSHVYCGSSAHPFLAVQTSASITYCASSSLTPLNGRLSRVYPGLRSSVGRSLRSRADSIARFAALGTSLPSPSTVVIPRRRCEYGPAHWQPPRDCIPKTSFNIAHT